MRSPRGQAAVELVAILPLIVLAAAVAWQLVAAGHAAWSAAGAARAAARAHAVGGEAAPAARAMLSAGLERRMRVSAGDDGEVEVRVRVPSILPVDLGTITATAHFEPQGG